MNALLILPLILLLASCASSSKSFLGNGVNPAGETLCLTDCAKIPSIIEKYMRSHDLITEEDEIDYFIYRISSSNNKFIRNNSEADSLTAAQFLRWKTSWYDRRHKDKIISDEDFIYKVTKGSEKSGQPYVVVLSDGSRHNLLNIMENELKYLEAYQGETPEAPSPEII